jgi:putative membrane protein
MMRQCIGLVVSAFVVVAVLLLISPAAAQKIDTKDADFVKEIAQGCILEVELGQYAMQNASSPEVKLFGKRVVDDHTKANKELMFLATQKGLKLATKLEDKKCQELCDKLSKLKGQDFDREYIRHMVEDHERDLAKFQTASKSLSDPDLKAWVVKILPTLTDHLKQAKEIQAKLEKKA